ncbi:hypothetical protein E4U33_003534 [Claviceps sp. LM78 group G4]|nr:hypothetical protein E4U33_003534 [Claviceps sp. LM78 group G4]
MEPKCFSELRVHWNDSLSVIIVNQELAFSTSSEMELWNVVLLAALVGAAPQHQLEARVRHVFSLEPLVL